MKHPSASWRTQGNDYLSGLIKHNPVYLWMQAMWQIETI